HYREKIYFTDIDGRPFAIKQMNCPGSILIYKSQLRSYRDLPLRMAELGTTKTAQRYRAKLYPAEQFGPSKTDPRQTRYQVAASWRERPSLASERSTTFCVAMPA
ncbi:hypothetical protein, partial [Acetomicrobium sp. S15 = DSM 107314]|uniref:hypothetical protein n=1 Tax=Acetomicrobium sp. S15 = DSM 107314 TaxID=2529858 RepID=UPI001E62F855